MKQLYELDRGKLQYAFNDFLENAGFDSYGLPVDEKLKPYVETERGVAYYCRSTSVSPEAVEKKGVLIKDDEINERAIFSYKGNRYEIWSDPDAQYMLDWQNWSDEIDKHYDPEVDDFIVPQELLDAEPDPKDYPVVKRIYLLKEREEINQYFENDTFLLRPYYWGDSEDIYNKPNFIYKPEGYEISWYKYPLRAGCANRKKNNKDFAEMLDKCLKSIRSVHNV